MNNIDHCYFVVCRNGQYGAIDVRGEIVVELRYEGIWTLSEGLLGFDDGKRSGLMDAAGRVVFDQGPYAEIREFHEGRAVVRRGKKFGYIDRDFREVVPAQFEFAYEFHEGLAHVAQGKWRGYIDLQGEPAIELPPGMTGDVFSGGRGMVIARKKRGYIDRSGDLIIPIRFVNARRFRDGLAAVWLVLGKTGKAGFIDDNGEFVIDPTFKDVVDFAEGLAPASREWLDLDREEVPLYGYIDKNGEWAIEPRFESAEMFADDRAPVSTRLKFSDPHGENWGVIDRAGRFVVEPRYSLIFPYEHGLAQVADLQDRRGYINRDGDVVWAPSA